MKTLVGLGNPGAGYVLTRHNVGVVFVNKLAEKLQSDYGWRRKKNIFVYESDEITLVKSAGVFMNESGKMIQELPQGVIPTKQSARRDPLISREVRDSSTSLGMTDGLIVIHDDLDIKLGEYKIQFGTGPKVHGGLMSIERELKTKDFWRVRIGIDNRQIPRNKIQETKNNGQWEEGEKYVLQRFSPEERKVLEGVLEKIIKEILFKFDIIAS